MTAQQSIMPPPAAEPTSAPPRCARAHIAMLVLLVAFFTGLTALWIHLNQAPTHWDDSWYLIDSLKMFDGLTTAGLRGWGMEFLGAQAGVKPPLMCALPTPIYLIFGRSLKAAMGVQLFFLPMLLLAVYGIVKRLWNGRAAVLAVFITGSLPIVYGLATWYIVELGLAALTAAAIWALIRSEDFAHTRFVLLFSFICGLGMLQKILFPLYAGPLAAYFLWRWWTRRRIARAIGDSAQSNFPRPLVTLASLCLPAFLIAGPWYAYNLRRAVERALFSGYSHREADLYGTGEPFTLTAIVGYFRKIVNEGIGPSYLLIAIAVGLFVLMFGRRGSIVRRLPQRWTGNRWIILGWWMLGFVVFLFGRNKDIRFIAPLLLVFSIVLAVGIDRILELWPKAWPAVLLALALPLVCQIMICFHPTRQGRDFVLSLGIGAENGDTSKGLRFVADRIGAARGYDPSLWPLDEAVHEISQAAGTKAGQYVYVVLGTDSQDFNSNNVQLAATNAKLPLGIGTTAYTDDKAELDKMIGQSDVYLYRGGGQAENNGYNLLRERGRRVARRLGFGETLSNLKFPDGAPLYIYVNKTHLHGPTVAFIPQELGRIDDCDVLYGEKIRLTGLTLSRAADRFIIRYRWRCDAPVIEQYKCFTHIVDEKGAVLGSVDHVPLDGDPPLPAWKPGDRGLEEISFPAAAFPPGGTGRLEIGLYLPRDSSILHAQADNLPAGWSLMQGSIGVHIDFPLDAPGPAGPATRP